MLVENWDHVLTKELINEVWGGGKPIAMEDGPLSAAISNLRDLLGRPRNRFIETVPGIGYRFKCQVKTRGPAGKHAVTVVESESTRERLTINWHEIYERQERMMSNLQILTAQVCTFMSFVQEMIGQIARCKMLTEQQQRLFFFDLGLKAGHRLTGPEQNAWLDTLECASDNLRATLNYYHDEPTGADRELELVVSLSHFWEIRGRFSEAREMLGQALARQRPGESVLKGKAFTWSGLFAYRQGDFEVAKQSLLKSTEINRKIEEKESLAFSLHCLGLVAEARGEYQQAKIYYSEALKWSREAKAPWRMAWDFHGLGHLAEAEEDYATAKKFHTNHLLKALEVGDSRSKSTALNNLGLIAQHEGNYTQSRQYHEQSLALRQGLANKSGIAYCHLHLGLLEDATGQSPRASGHFQQSLLIFWEIGNRIGVARVMEAAGKTAAAPRMRADSLRTAISAPLSPVEKKKYRQINAEMKRKYLRSWKEGSGLTGEAIPGLICNG